MTDAPLPGLGRWAASPSCAIMVFARNRRLVAKRTIETTSEEASPSKDLGLSARTHSRTAL
jgi:hypothetical protein